MADSDMFFDEYWQNYYKNGVGRKYDSQKETAIRLCNSNSRSQPLMKSSINMSELSTICRTCMKHGSDFIGVSCSLFSSEMEQSDVTNITNALAECTSIQIENTDGLPQAICSNCLTALITSYNFRHQALQAEIELKKQLVDSNMKNEISIKSEFETSAQPDNLCSFTNNYEGLRMSDLLKEETAFFECKQCTTLYQSQEELTNHLLSHAVMRDDVSTAEPVEDFLHRSMPDAISELEGCESILDNDEGNETGIILDADYLIEDYTGDKIVDNLKKFQCSHCNMEFLKRKSLVNHLNKHQNASYTCEVCGLLFSQRTLLNRHRKLHSDDKPYKCTKCHKSYSRSDQFKDHMLRHDGIKPKICPYCSKGFSQSCSLKEHIRTHTGETPFLCSQCGKGFNNSSNLRQHMMRHSGIKPYACTLCPKTFCTKGQLNGHMMSHTDAQPYKCSQCASAFTKPQSLKKHSLIHLGLKPFECDACPMRFADKNHLKRHHRTHTGEKPYQCQHCDRAFAQSNDLVKHLRIHVGKNIYRCSVCGIGFRLQNELRRHYPSHYASGAEPLQEDILEPSPSASITCPEASSNMTNIQTKTHDDGRITITFTGDLINKAAYHQGFTIDMMPEKS